ncbi:WD repeat domain 90 [Perkinsus olseni]|uniref:WD repeat domain 90 n=1 Tax=Perkinsus olseni TaxID=32597 RepID=A0A7J6U5Q7_PEROL|nr:WD repeat domain 90 [Perkinsus olseni]
MMLCSGKVCGAWPIQALRFSPFRPSAHTNIVSCGFENIRFWRVKDQHLAGVSVQLNQLARETVFTDLDFEASKSLRPAGAVPQDADGKEEEAAILHYRVFVATACGRVIQLHYNTRQVENVYRLYDDGCPIWAITVTEGFVCTAGDDGYVRVWPLDFTNYYMQAKLPGPVYGLDLTPDDLQLVCSVGDGSVGVLDLEACKYSVVSRSHKSKIRCAAVSSCGTKLCTAAADGCMRVWEIANGTAKTLLEFKADPDFPTSLAFQPSIAIEDDEAPLLAVGFESGAVMIFEISAVGDHSKTSSPMFELKHHANFVTSLSFASVSSSSLLLSGDTTGRIVVHDEARKFEATRCPDSVVSKPILPVVPSTKEDVQIQPPTFALRPASHHHTMIALYSHERAIALAQLPDLETSRVLKVNHMQKATAAITTYTVRDELFPSFH